MSIRKNKYINLDSLDLGTQTCETEGRAAPVTKFRASTSVLVGYRPQTILSKSLVKGVGVAQYPRTRHHLLLKRSAVLVLYCLKLQYCCIWFFCSMLMVLRWWNFDVHYSAWSLPVFTISFVDSTRHVTLGMVRVEQASLTQQTEKMIRKLFGRHFYLHRHDGFDDFYLQDIFMIEKLIY